MENRLNEIKDTVEVDETTKKVIFHYPNKSMEYDMSRYQSQYHRLMSKIYMMSGRHSYVAITAAGLVRDAELTQIPSINITERDRVEELKSLNHYKDTTIGLWATDKPELFKNHPNFDLLFQLN